MARPSRLVLGLALALCAHAAANAQAPAPTVNVIPEPLSVQASPGGQAPVTIADGEVILVPRADAGAERTARQFRDLVHRTRGLKLVVQAGDPPPADRPAIVLSRAAGLPSEAYGLEIGARQARVSASDDAGLFYGAVTLWQLMTPDSGRGPARLSPMRIDDRPRFPWRGLMLDSARHYQSPDFIKQMIDWMSLHKLNTLQWHLTDDQGWRLQILKYPRLTEVGAWRTPPAGSPDANPSGRYGGFYTQDQVREIVAYAAARHVTIVPEIEMPGHTVSALLAYPNLGAGQIPAAADQTKWGGFPYAYNIQDQTFAVLEDVLTEVMALFPSQYIHVGGDEASMERWNTTPEVQARLKALGLADSSAVQPYFTRRIESFLAAHGRRLVGWDEILQGGGLPGSAVVTSWHGVEGALAAAAQGHDAILSPAPVLYFDNWQAAGADEPPGRGYLVPLKDVYAFEPAPASLSPETARHMLGLQAALWAEHIRTEAALQAMAFPRAAAIAESGWSDPARKDWNSFVRRLPAQFARYDALGLKADPAALSVAMTSSPSPGGGAQVALAAQPGPAEIRYTTDGTVPTAASARFNQPFAVPLPARVRAALFVDGARLGPVADRQLDALSVRRRSSQELKLCNDRLALNLEGVGDGQAPDPAYLVNPLDPCWIYPAADLDGIDRVAVTLGRLPFNFALDAGHNTTLLHPPRAPAGELEVRQDSCASDPIAVAPVPPGAVGDRARIEVRLPPRSGRHDLCFTFTSLTYDPIIALDTAQLLPAGVEAPDRRP